MSISVNSLWQRWSCGLVLASSDGISTWTPLKPQLSNPNPNPLANSGVLTSLLLPHLSSYLTDSLPSLNLLCHSKTDVWFIQVAPKAVGSIPYVSVKFIPSRKQNFIAYRSSKVSSRPDCFFEIHQLWQSGFSRVYSNSWCSCSFESGIIKMGQSSDKMYSNKILNSQESVTILNASKKQVWKLIEVITYLWTSLLHRSSSLQKKKSKERKKVRWQDITKRRKMYGTGRRLIRIIVGGHETMA